MRLTLEKFRWILIAVLIAVLSACSGGGTATSNPTPSAPMSNLGTLSNGSMVWITNNTLPVIPSKSTNALISITGGTTNDPYTISFESTVVQPFQVSKAKNVISSIVNESNGITVTTTPATCIIAVGSNSYPGSCPVKITVAPNTPAGIYLITPIATDQSNNQQVLSPIRVLVNGSTSLSANAITSFDFTLPSGAITSGVINGQNISVVVPAGTNVSNLVAQYVTTGVSISVGGITQVNSVSGNNFTSPLQYVVKAANGTTQTYTVTVTFASSSANSMISYSLNGTSGVIDGQTIYVTMPFGTNLNNLLIATYTTSGVNVSIGAKSQVSTETQNVFTAPVVYTVKAANGSTQNYTVIVTVAPSSAKAITAFSINDSNGIIDGQNIYVTLPFGTDITNLNPTFTSTGESVSINGTLQVSGVTSNDFTSPVLYTVTAADSSTQNYTVTVIIAPNTANEITTFSLNGTQGIIVNQNITVEMPYGSNLSDLIATFTTTGESVSISGKLQVSGITSNDFTSPIVYTVTAANGATQNYTVTVIVAPNTAKDILSFSLNTSPSPSSGVITPIDESSASIAVVVPYGTDLSALIATFSTNGESVNISGTPQVSSVTTNNFSSPLVYTVTAADGTTKNYTVVVTIAPNNVADILSYSINGNDGIITESKIAVKVPYGTNLTIPLIAKFQLSPGAKSTVNVLSINVPQISGITPNSFANPVVYTVTAADGTTIKQYTVTVTVGPADADTMVTFSLRGSTGLLIAGKIDDDQGTITVDMPWKTYPNFLVASFNTGGAESVTVAYTHLYRW